MKKENLPILYVTITCFFLSFCHCPLFEIFNDDKEIFKYTGLAISKGGVPYRDFFDHKPPLIFFLNYLGQLFGPWGFWLIDTILALLASILFLRLCRRFKLKYPWMLPILFNIMIRYSIVCLGTGQTREYTTVFLLMFFCLMLGHARYKHYLLGLLTALVLFMQQEQVITMLPFVVFALFSQSDGNYKKMFPRVIQFGIGSLVVIVPILLYFQIHHAIGNFWKDAVLFNTQWYLDRLPLVRQLEVLKHRLSLSEFDNPFYSAAILGIASLFLKHRNKRLLTVCLFALFLSFSAEYLSGKLNFLECYYYFLPLAATIPSLLFVVFAFSEESFLAQGTPQLIFTAMLSAKLLLGTLRYVSGLTTNEDKIKKIPEMQFIKLQPLSNYQFFVFGNGNYVYVYNQDNILCPTRWVYQHFYFWYPNWDKDFAIIKTITADLESHKTTYVLDYSSASARRPILNNSILQFWKDFLHAHYQPVKINGMESLLWKWKD